MNAENRYLLKWSKVLLIIIIPLSVFGIYMALISGRTSIVFICIGLIIGMLFSFFLENKIFSKLEKILGIRLKKNKSFSKGSYTYEGLPWLLLFMVLIANIAIFYPWAIGYKNFPAYVGFLFIGIYPLVIMILRRNTFSDNSIPSARNHVYVGSNRVSGGPGYNPLYYLLFSFAIGCASTVWGFSMLNFPDIPLQQGLSLVFMGLIGQTLVLFPDKFNKISPYDTRTRKGLYFMMGITIAIIICIEILSNIFM
ncbi:MAG: hypothetical protein KO316_07980 [Methanobacterium sp.]|nr:hypothetical protein [Methanobacterium sp.]